MNEYEKDVLEEKRDQLLLRQEQEEMEHDPDFQLWTMYVQNLARALQREDDAS